MSENNDYSELYGFKEDNNSIASPGAQTFTAPYSAYLSSVNLYFRAGKTPDYGITMEIRNVINGLPGDKYYSRTSLENTNAFNQINIDPSGNTPTNFKFDNPVFLQGGKQYAIVLYTTSVNYQLAASVVGEYRRNAEANVTTEGINSNQEVNGTFCYSMDGKTWNTGDPTTHLKDAANGTICLKFDVNTAKFNTNESKDLYDFSPADNLNNIHYSARSNGTMNNMSYFTFLPSVFTPNNTSVDWYYTINSNKRGDRTPISKGDTIPINTDVNDIHIWAQMNGSQNVSPVINTGSMSLTTQTTAVDGDNTTRPDESEGMIVNVHGDHSTNPFSGEDDVINAGEYISRNIDFNREDESQDPQFTDIFASYEFQNNGAPRPSIYFNLNANNDPSNGFNPMWIQMPGYDEHYNDHYAIIDPYDSTEEALDSKTGTSIDHNIVNQAFGMRHYSQDITDDPYHPETNWIRYHFHVSIKRLLQNYYAYSNEQKETPIAEPIYNPRNKPNNAYEIEFKIVFHSDSIYHHPKVRKFRTTMNDSDNDDLSEVAPS